MCSCCLESKHLEPRDLTSEEKKILNKMLAADVIDKEIIINQIKTAKVIGHCTCGCKTISIYANHNMPRYTSCVRVPVEMVINASDGVPIQFLLHIIDGYVSELEVLRVDSQPINEEIKLDDAVITTNP